MIKPRLALMAHNTRIKPKQNGNNNIAEAKCWHNYDKTVDSIGIF